MADHLDKLAATILRNAADTTQGVLVLALSAGWTAEQALSRLSKMFRDLADVQEGRAASLPTKTEGE